MDFDKARECYETGAALAHKIGLRDAEGKMLGNLGLVHLQLGALEKAAECLRASLEFATWKATSLA
jgi:tetratricopeptide (TPR) repeat protein